MADTGTDHAQDNASEETRVRIEGHVIECDGTNAIVAAAVDHKDHLTEDYWSVGQLISLQCNINRRVVGLLHRVTSVAPVWSTETVNETQLHVELVGEVIDTQAGPLFQAGLSEYPHLGSICHRIRAADLAAIFVAEGEDVASVGALTQNQEIPALIAMEKMIARHFAVVGTTGVGKSTAVSLLLHRIVALKTGLRIIVLDPHNEFSRALPNDSITIDENNFSLPHWLFSVEEFSEAVFGGRAAPEQEVDLLRELIAQARTEATRKADASSGLLKRKRKQITADTPLPYRISDLLSLIDERMGRLENKREIHALRNLSNRIQLTSVDPDYGFMFTDRLVTDTIEQLLSLLFRIPHEGRPVTILQLGGIPSTIINATVSVLCRMAFDLGVRSAGAIRTLIVCEEAHRYIPADTSAGFGPTRAIISRIAKEGRKYGVHLAVITQRPSELDQTILSQCNTIFAMRLGNENDQRIVQKALTGGSRSFSHFISSLANREAIAFGEGAKAPMRLTFDEVPQDWLPGMVKDEHDTAAITRRPEPTVDDLRRVIAGLRNDKHHTEDDESTMVTPEQPLPQREGRFDVPTGSIRKKTVFSATSSLQNAGAPRHEPHVSPQSDGQSLISRFRRPV